MFSTFSDLLIYIHWNVMDSIIVSVIEVSILDFLISIAFVTYYFDLDIHLHCDNSYFEFYIYKIFYYYIM